MHQDEAAVRFDQGADFLADLVIGRNRCANGDAAVLGDFRGDVADAEDVDVPMAALREECGYRLQLRTLLEH